MRCKLHLCYHANGTKVENPKGVFVDLNVGKDMVAVAFPETGSIGSLHLNRVKFEWAAGLGFLLSGVEEFHDKKGQQAFRYQEWWVVTPTHFSNGG